jgi:hypothetical protein
MTNYQLLDCFRNLTSNNMIDDPFNTYNCREIFNNSTNTSLQYDYMTYAFLSIPQNNYYNNLLNLPYFITTQFIFNDMGLIMLLLEFCVRLNLINYFIFVINNKIAKLTSSHYDYLYSLLPTNLILFARTIIQCELLEKYGFELKLNYPNDSMGWPFVNINNDPL